MRGTVDLARVTLSSITNAATIITAVVKNMVALAFAKLQRRTRSKAAQNAERVRGIVLRRQVQW